MIIKQDSICQSKQTIDQHKTIFLLCTNCKDHIPSMQLWKTQDNISVFLNCQFCKQTDLVELQEYLDLMKQLTNQSHKCTHKIQHALAPSDTYCMTCSNWLCNDCNEDHTLSTELSHHTKLSTKIIIESQCKLHQGNQYEYYCQNCNQSLCKDCLQSHEELKHQTPTVADMKSFITNFNIKDILNQFNSIRNTNKDNKNTLIDSINTQIQKLNDLKEQIISEYKQNERLNEILNTFIVALSTNYELLNKSHSIELMYNLCFLLVTNKTLPKLNQCDLNTDCLNMIDYFKSNYIVRVIHKQRDTDNSKHNGDWVDDNIMTYVQYVWLDGAQYNGQCKNDKQHGKGIYTYLDGRTYDGDWIDNNKEGYGIYKWPNGAQYNGQWKNDKTHGKGIYTDPDGSTYDGDWIDNKKEGDGVLKLLNGAQYKGQWKNDKKHGKGIYTYPDGRTYDGDWIDGNREGYGILKLVNGTQYKGQWKNDKTHGKGIYTDPAGTTYDGDWIDGKMIKK